MGVAHFKKEWISEERFRPYLERMFHAEEAALELYLVDRKLASAFFRDIAFIEVALRNAINRLLAEKFGSDWYARAEVGFDARVRGNISEAWDSLPRRYTAQQVVRGATLGSRIVAASMFRTWTNMLDKGGGTGLAAPFERADHDQIWDSAALLEVFPGARQLARAQDPNFSSQGLTREWVYHKVLPVRKIRNRVAHHEPLVLSGVPITGTNHRLSPRESFNAYMDLAAMLDRDLASFLEGLRTSDELKQAELLLDAVPD